jgi:hypothetical protein
VLACEKPNLTAKTKIVKIKPIFFILIYFIY